MLLVEFIELYHVTKVCRTVTIPRFYKLKANNTVSDKTFWRKKFYDFYSANGKILPNTIFNRFNEEVLDNLSLSTFKESPDQRYIFMHKRYIYS